MKRIFFLISGLVSMQMSMAQSKPVFTQYAYNNYLLNPALSGMENYTDIRASYREQWRGIDGAPKTGYVTAHGRLFGGDGSTGTHHGWGAAIMNDRAGYLNRWSISGSYAYQQSLNETWALAAGFQAGLSNIGLDRSKVNYGNLNDADLAIGFLTNDLRRMNLEMGVGLWLHTDKLFIGASVLNIVTGKNKFQTEGTFGQSFTPNYFYTTGYRFELNEDFKLTPSIMLQYWEPQLLGTHLNARVDYRDFMWAGGSFRYGSALSGMSAFLGMRVTERLNFNYAYEVATTSQLRNFAGNTHELIIGFKLGGDADGLEQQSLW
jgi:type IX secretion system PorP/SprF family membrane protein